MKKMKIEKKKKMKKKIIKNEKRKEKNVASEIYAKENGFLLNTKIVHIKITETFTQPSRKISSWNGLY